MECKCSQEIHECTELQDSLGLDFLENDFTGVCLQAVGNRIEELTDEIKDIKKNGLTITLRIEDNCSGVVKEKTKRIEVKE